MAPGVAGRGRARAVAAAAAGAVLLAGAVSVAPRLTAETWRETSVDAILLALGPPRSDRVVVVDIDRATIAATGPWPWSRSRIADLVDAVAAGVPQLVGVDILLAGPDRAAPQTLLSRLPEPQRSAVAPILAGLPDPDARLADALSSVPAVLAVLLADDPAEVPAAPPLVVSGAPPRLAPWGAPGATAPYGRLLDGPVSVGVASLEQGVGDRVRAVPLLASAGGQVLPGFAAEVVRTGELAGSFILDGAAGTLGIGRHVVPLPVSADLRIRPSGPAHWAERTVSAGDVLAGRIPPERFENRIVLVGGSSPDLGGLRVTAASPVAPSVQIQADAIETMLAGRVPVRPDDAGRWELAAAALLALAGLIAGLSATPLGAAVGVAGAAAGWAAGAAALLALTGLAVDPVTPALAALASGVPAALVTAVEARRAAASVRRRFEQHLAPEVVERIVGDPDLVRLAGERREVTALFTDIEGFSATADALGPTALVAMLDRYFDSVARIVVAHGGMVDKFVGDAVHALFNAPLDLSDHPRAAVRAAIAIAAETEALRALPEMAGLGRTRIGIETGPAVVGDVGTGVKLDYTAHGTAVNTAARLEALNKELGTTICVGPECRSRVDGIAFRPVGAVEVRGIGRLEVFEPVPEARPGVAPVSPARSGTPPRSAPRPIG